MSIEPFKRVLWIVLDGMGHEHALRCRERDGFPAFERIATEGYLGPSVPATPVCQTPPALLALFSGAQPAETGVWGYYMPHPQRVKDSISGFFAKPGALRTLWDELEERGLGYSLLNVAFRNDAVWTGGRPRLVLAYDGYRLWTRPVKYGLRGRTRITYRGIVIEAAPGPDGIVLRKGSRSIARLAVGSGALVGLSAGTRVFAQLLDAETLVLSPLIPPAVRGQAAMKSPEGFLDASVFRIVRNASERKGAEGVIPVAAEMVTSTASMAQKTELLMSAAGDPRARCVVGYFPIIDEFNHAYFDLLESRWPEGRASEVFVACAGLVDAMLEKVMAAADRDTLLVVSSDHGAVSSRSQLHLNELLADEGLVRRSSAGYDLGRSAACYHPSDCGLVVARTGIDRLAAVTALRRALDRARGAWGVDIGLLELDGDTPRLAFLYPLGDGYFTGKPPAGGRPVLDKRYKGGHHLSPLTPTPWIQAMLGLWSPRSRDLSAELGPLPRGNVEVKRFLLSLIGPA